MKVDVSLAFALEATHGWCIGEYAHSVARTRPHSRAAVLAVNTGLCICAESAPFNFAVGLALGREITRSEFADVEQFFRYRDLPSRVDVTPFSDPSLKAHIDERGYSPSEYTSVLLRGLDDEIPASPISSDVEIRWAEEEDCDAWVDVVAKCFVIDDLTPGRRANLAALFHASKSLNLIAYLNGEIAGVAGGMLPSDRGLGAIFASSVMPQYRYRGIHGAMLRKRLERARDMGCKRIAVTATPGSISERNLLRIGFSPCYEKVTYVAPMM